MKWKRSKKAQQEAKAKAAAERAAKQNGTPLPSSMNKTPENKSKRITEEDEALSSDQDCDEDIDVGGEDHDSDSMTGTTGNNPCNLVAPTPILGLPHPPALQLRPLMHPQQPQPSIHSSMIRPSASLNGSNSMTGNGNVISGGNVAGNTLSPMETNLSALLPAHLARLSQAAASQGNRLYRPFVA